MYIFILLMILTGCASTGTNSRVKSEVYFEAKAIDVKPFHVEDNDVSNVPSNDSIIYDVQVYPDGTKYWYQYGNLNRVAGPAVEYADGTKLWYKNGLLHRDDGPAVEYRNGKKEWWIDGIQYTEKAFKKVKKL